MARNLPPDPDAQRRALRLWKEREGTLDALATAHDIAMRQMERFASGKQMLPPGLCDNIARQARDSLTARYFRTLAQTHAQERDRQRADRTGS